MSPDRDPTPPVPETFAAAIDELEEILRRIEEEEIDIDRLAAELRRATLLLEVCRSKVRKAEIEVTQIVQDLEGSAGDAAAAEDAGDEAEP